MKKVLLLMMAIALCAIMANAENYGINVGGVEVSSSNCSNVTGGNITGGTVEYDSYNKILRLTNVTITRTTSSDFALHNRSCDGLTVIFYGTCNLTSTKAHGIKLDKSTALNVYSGATVNVTSGTGSALYLGNIQVWFKGSGNINFKTTNGSTNACIKGSDATESIYDGAHVTAKSYNYYAMEMLINTFHAGTDLRLYYNGVKQQVYNCVLQNMISPAKGAPAILEPYGAYVNTTARTTIYTSSGEPVRSADIYISDNYAAILNATYFPDANFRSALLSLYPKGYLTSSDVVNCTSLNVSGKNISSLTGLEYFTKLTSLNCSNNNLTSLPSLPSTLVSLISQNNQLTSLPSLPSGLKFLNCGSNKLTSLPAMPNSIEEIACSNNQFTSLSLNHLSNLTVLACGYNSNLTTLNCSNNALTTLIVTDCSALNYLTCNNNQLTSLNVSSLSNLRVLDCSKNKLSSLNVSNKTKLVDLKAFENQLTSLDVKGCSALSNLQISHNKLSSLSVQGCSALYNVYCFFNQITGSGMNTLVNSLRTIPAGSQGTLNVIAPGLSEAGYTEGNIITTAQVMTARNKRWLPRKWVAGTGWVEIPGVIPGDVNGDGIVSSVDVTALYNWFLTGDDSSAIVNGDQDDDGVITAGDIMIIYNILLGQ